MRFDQIVAAAGYPGTQMIPPTNALLSLLTPKLLDKERLSHIDDFNCDEALGLFAGLNILPKKSFATDYSYRTIRDNQVQLLERWVKKLSPLLFPDADSFSLDFHAIGHRGEETDLKNHFQPTRGKAAPSLLTFFAIEQKSKVFLLLKRKSDSYAAVQPNPQIHRLLAKADGEESTVAVLRFEDHDVRRVIPNHTAERCFICDDSPSRQQHPEAS